MAFQKLTSAFVPLKKQPHYVFQKVVRREPFGVQPDPRDLKYILCGMREFLACGHEKVIPATPEETFTARVRNCWECSGWAGRLKLPEKEAEQVQNQTRQVHLLKAS